MSDLDNEFRAWMDDKKLRAEAVGKALDVSAQTIRNWRADKLPRRKHDAVRRIMREWDTDPTTQIGQRLTVHASDQQFEAWNRAALNANKTLTEWAREGLDEMAREYFENPQMQLGLKPNLTPLPTTLAAEKPDDPSSLKRLGSTRYPKAGGN